jgi:hypothetical protein
MRRRFAVILADVMASEKQRRLRDTLARKLHQASRAHRAKGWIALPYAVTAGDEFQAVVLRIDVLPEIILDLRRRLRPLGLRIAAGVGAIPGPVHPPVNRLQGEAFVRARRAMEALKSGRLHKYPSLTAFHTGKPRLDAIANLIYGLSDTLLRAATLKQWQAMNAYAAVGQVRLAARAMRLDESTVSRRLSRGHYWQMTEAASTLARLLQAEFMRLPSRRHT